jgi:hypothetical protein
MVILSFHIHSLKDVIVFSRWEWHPSQNVVFTHGLTGPFKMVKNPVALYTTKMIIKMDCIYIYIHIIAFVVASIGPDEKLC